MFNKIRDYLTKPKPPPKPYKASPKPRPTKGTMPKHEASKRSEAAKKAAETRKQHAEEAETKFPVRNPDEARNPIVVDELHSDQEALRAIAYGELTSVSKARKIALSRVEG